MSVQTLGKYAADGGVTAVRVETNGKQTADGSVSPAPTLPVLVGQAAKQAIAMGVNQVYEHPIATAFYLGSAATGGWAASVARGSIFVVSLVAGAATYVGERAYAEAAKKIIETARKIAVELPARMTVLEKARSETDSKIKALEASLCKEAQNNETAMKELHTEFANLQAQFKELAKEEKEAREKVDNSINVFRNRVTFLGGGITRLEDKIAQLLPQTQKALTEIAEIKARVNELFQQYFDLETTARKNTKEAQEAVELTNNRAKEYEEDQKKAKASIEALVAEQADFEKN